jgi:hypothetical protein
MPEQSEWLRVMSWNLLSEAIPPEIEKRDRLNKAAGPLERKNRPPVPLYTWVSPEMSGAMVME